MFQLVGRWRWIESRIVNHRFRRHHRHHDHSHHYVVTAERLAQRAEPLGAPASAD
jgi:hypothetical protein